ncbi:MAG: helix-hairpin-helix domain-containing protein [Bacteroidales bacterium]
MNTFRKILTAWFTLSRSERNGTLVLVVILTLLIILRILMPSFIKEIRPDHEKALEEAMILQQKMESPVRADSFDYPDEPVSFDPNTATVEQLRLAGMQEKNIRTLINFRSKGGEFRTATDLKKLYGLSQTEYARLLPWIVIHPRVEQGRSDRTVDSARTTQVKGKKETYPRKVILPLELNSADSSTLETLPGIGPVLASRIVRYREKLGGFHELAQLQEVYGITPELAGQLAPRLVLDSTLIRKINLNAGTLEQDLKHPYLTRWQVSSILKYRESRKQIISSLELIQYKILKPEEFARIKPYLLP